VLHRPLRIQSWLNALAVLCLIFCVTPANLLPRSDTDQASVFRSSGWNTWDIGRPNAMVDMPEGVGLELTIYDPQTGQSFGRPFLKDVQHFGAHSPDGSYCFARYKQGDFTYEIEFASVGNDLVAHVRPLTQTNYLLVAEISFYFGRTGTIHRQGDGLVVNGKSVKFYAASPNPERAPSGLTNEHRMVWDLSGDRWVTLSSQRQQIGSPVSYQTWVDEAREGYEKERVRSDGFLEDGAQAAVDVAAWNMVWNPRRDMPVTTVAREFPAGSGIGWGGYIQGCWDAVFQSIIAELQSPSMAEASIRGLMADETTAGFLGGGTGWGVGKDHSQPPLVSYALLKFYKEHGNRKILEEAFPSLYQWHEWWPSARDGNKDGLLEWGSNPVGDPATLEYYKKMVDVLLDWIKRIGLRPPNLQTSDVMDNSTAAGYESGLDNSEMWDGVKFNKQTHTQEQDDVGLNSLYALDAWALAEIAHVLGHDADEQKLRHDFMEMGTRVNKLMWSEEDGMYLNKQWDGTFNRRVSPTNFYPMLAGITTPERAHRMVQQYLLNPQKFWGEYVVPVTPRDDPAFRDNSYWRGRIWAPTNYLVYEGLRRSGMAEVAAQVAEKSTELFLKDWHAKGHIHENYNATSGDADDVPNTVSYYGWGGLLPLMMVEELIDVEPWGSGLRLGSLSGETASVHNVRIMNDSYDVFLGPGLRVSCNGEKFLETDHPVLIRNFDRMKDHVHFEIAAKKDTRLTLYGFRPNEKINCSSCREKLAVGGYGHVIINIASGLQTIDLQSED
jgi:putative isomerase